MALVKDRHNDLFKSKVDELRGDVGRDIIIHTKSTPIDCQWCEFDESTGRSAGIPSAGKDWTTHPNYRGSLIRCPNCNSLGTINPNTETVVPDVIIEDKSGLVYEKGKAAIIPEGTKSLIGKLSDVLLDSSDINSKTLFAHAIRVIVDGESYRVRNVKRFGLKGNYLFEATIELSNPLEVEGSALYT